MVQCFEVMSWDKYFFELAKTVSLKSTVPTVKVGAVIIGVHKNVLSTGYNGVVRKLPHEARFYERPLKHPLVIHAEANAILNAARHGVALDGSTVYVTLPPCGTCLGMMIQVGICKVCYLSDKRSNDQMNELDKLNESCLNIYKSFSDISLVEFQI